jgi:hypothetical protein
MGRSIEENFAFKDTPKMPSLLVNIAAANDAL